MNTLSRVLARFGTALLIVGIAVVVGGLFLGVIMGVGVRE